VAGEEGRKEGRGCAEEVDLANEPRWGGEEERGGQWRCENLGKQRPEGRVRGEQPGGLWEASYDVALTCWVKRVLLESLADGPLTFAYPTHQGSLLGFSKSESTPKTSLATEGIKIQEMFGMKKSQMSNMDYKFLDEEAELG
jgi:hypothetical protein